MYGLLQTTSPISLDVPPSENTPPHFGNISCTLPVLYYAGKVMTAGVASLPHKIYRCSERKTAAGKLGPITLINLLSFPCVVLSGHLFSTPRVGAPPARSPRLAHTGVDGKMLPPRERSWIAYLGKMPPCKIYGALQGENVVRPSMTNVPYSPASLLPHTSAMC